jgi:hypothetical protein
MDINLPIPPMFRIGSRWMHEQRFLRIIGFEIVGGVQMVRVRYDDDGAIANINHELMVPGEPPALGHLPPVVIFRNPEQLLAKAEYGGRVDLPGYNDFVTNEPFINGEDIIIIRENGQNYIYKMNPLIQRFKNNFDQPDIDITNPTTNTKICDKNRALPAVFNAGITIKIGRIADAIMMGGKHKKSYKRRKTVHAQRKTLNARRNGIKSTRRYRKH